MVYKNLKMDKIKKVVSGGCSFTAGAELADHKRLIEPLGSIRFAGESTWAHRVQKNLYPSATVDNVGMVGSDFGSCVRRVIYHIDNLIKSFNPEEIVVLVMWTSLTRREYPRILPKKSIERYVDDEDKFFCSQTTDADGFFSPHKGTIKQRRAILSEEYLKNTIRDFYRNRTESSNIIYYPLQQIEYLISYLNSQNVKFYFTSAFDDFAYYITMEREPNIFLDGMIKRLDLKNIIHREDNLGFYNWAKQNGYKFGPQVHPLEKAHKIWGDKFSNFIPDQRSLS